MRLAVRLLHCVRAHAMLVHRKRHQRDAEPCGNALHERIGQRLDAAASAGRHDGGERGGDALPAIGGEHDLVGIWRPALAREEFRGDRARRPRAETGRRPQRALEHLGPLQPFEALGDHRRLMRQQRIVEFEIDAGAAWFGRSGDAAARFAGHEGAAADFTDHQPAPQQLGVDPARSGDRDVAVIGEMALRRQAVARLQRAAGDLGGDRIRQLQIFEPRHYCTESNVLLAPSNVPDHLRANKPMIAPRSAQAIRGYDGAGVETAFASTA
ncbi:hypothetical protein ACVWW1_000728 [Bradyrhizobium sp. JR3.5]